jgi:uncharacterized cupredoxin-like copper-binding protein
VSWWNGGVGRMERTPIGGLSIVLALALALGGCSNADTGARTPGPTEGGTAASSEGAATGTPEGTVNVSLSEFSVSARPSEVAAGDVTFVVTSRDGLHEFLVIRTDLAPDALPEKGKADTPIGEISYTNVRVDEDAPGLEVVGEVEDVEFGSAETLDVSLDPGNYVLICNIPAHYHAGMFTAFTVD